MVGLTHFSRLEKNSPAYQFARKYKPLKALSAPGGPFAKVFIFYFNFFLASC